LICVGKLTQMYTESIDKQASPHEQRSASRRLDPR
jgi:hypothetical protein